MPDGLARQRAVLAALRERQDAIRAEIEQALDDDTLDPRWWNHLMHQWDGSELERDIIERGLATMERRQREVEELRRAV